ncbi:MAG TPA: hypothetical protein VFC59_00205, partial [Cryobacterium sp.]|nr:hypothetical protein [Cryobacterium sp.]
MTRKRIRRAGLALVAIVATVAVGAAVGLGIINSGLVDPLVARLPAATAAPGASPSVASDASPIAGRASPTTPGTSPPAPGASLT